MKKILFPAFVSVVLLNIHTALGWGPKGHDIIAYVAECNVSNKTKKAVTEALGGHTFVYYASWMDNIREVPGYEGTATWHYANVDEGQTYETMIKEANGDVYTALCMVMEALKEHRNTGDSLERAYVRFLIHLTADMHCPMHAGRRSDRGGNDFLISWFGKPTNLHAVWDVDMIEDSHRWSYSEWRENIDFLDSGRKKRICEGSVMDWFTETVNVCKKLYMRVNSGDDCSWFYVFDNYPVLELQLQKAGYRLAYLLDSIYK